MIPPRSFLGVDPRRLVEDQTRTFEALHNDQQKGEIDHENDEDYPKY